VPVTAVHLLRGLVEHVLRQVDADHVDVARVRIDGKPGTDADLEHVGSGRNPEAFDDLVDPPSEHTCEDVVVDAGKVRIDAAVMRQLGALLAGLYALAL